MSVTIDKATLDALVNILGVDPFEISEHPNSPLDDPRTGLPPCSSCGTKDDSARVTTGRRWVCLDCAARITAALEARASVPENPIEEAGR